MAQARVARTMLSARRRRIGSCKHATIVTSIAPNGEPNRSLEERKNRTRFPRSLRLLRHADFERVYESGGRHFSASLTAFYLARSEAQTTGAKPSGLRVGFTVSRALGGAVQRNRIKRRLREAVRLAPPPVAIAADVVINPKKTVLTADFEAVLNEVRRAFVVVEQKLTNGTASKGPGTEGTTGWRPGRKSTGRKANRN